MDLLKLIVTEYLLSPAGLIGLAGVALFTGTQRWLSIRGHAKRREAQMAALTPLVQRLGGRLLGPGEAAMWTDELRKPFTTRFSIAFRSKRQFDLSLDFQRGPWHVRVTEAAIRYDSRGYGVTWLQEHRIEIATARLAPLKMKRPDKYNVNNDQPLSPGQLEREWREIVDTEAATAANENAPWLPVPLAPPMDREFSAYGSDPAAAARELNFDALHWLIEREGELPGWAKRLPLTFESGFAYLVVHDHIYPDELMGVVDTLCGLLDRMPGVRPRHPAAVV